MIPIVFSTDHNFVMPTGVTICSMLLSADTEVYDIYILISRDVTYDDREKLKLQVAELSPSSKISFLEMGDSFKSGYEVRGISTACYYRLMIPWLLPEIDKIIYCDVDVIIKTSLKELYNVDLEGKYVAGTVPSTKDGWAHMKKYLSRLGLDYREYINSGVLVINSALQRRDALDKEYAKLAERKFIYQDQDIINIVCKGRISHFSCRFNFKPSEYGIHQEVGREIVIHYAGDKPWNGFCYAWDEWWEVYKKSIFWDGEFYHKISSAILNPLEMAKVLKRKTLFKMKLLLAKFK